MNESEKKVPAVVIKRLPRYYRYLSELLNQGITRISSNALSEKMNVTASQIRQDFNYFGGFGQQGYGYNVEHLYSQIGDILGLNDGDTMVIVGAGNLGTALANHDTFEKRGFRLIGVFDNDPKVIGTTVNGREIMSTDALEDFLEKNRVDIGVITVPHTAVEETAEKLVNSGVKGLLNFSYMELKFDKDVAVENVHLSDPLMTLSYRIKQSKNGE
ncbi:MAG: redox-sensing transcriptional repressor Rex [Clostridia bacterium]|nr:redox-sensing transcriptional repressor Rex [Clostridia bacterium]MBQ3463726.1 redox-sensing transcriptional repressor Rex [Clostridia bacterium]